MATYQSIDEEWRAFLTGEHPDLPRQAPLAERIGPAKFREVLNRFYVAAADVLLETDALVDKFVGDEVIGLFIPALTGADHAARAVAAAEALLKRTGHEDPEGGRGFPWARACIRASRS